MIDDLIKSENCFTRSQNIVKVTGVINIVLLSLSVGTSYWPIVISILSIANIYIFLFANRYQYSDRVPIWDIGVICGLVTFTYSLFPLLNYIAGDLQFTKLSDRRMNIYSPTPYQLSNFVWNHIIYGFCFAITYIIFAKKQAVPLMDLKKVEKTTLYAVTFFLSAVFLYFFVLKIVFGYQYSLPYSVLRYNRLHGTEIQLPLIIEQITHYIDGWKFILKIMLMTLIFGLFRKKYILFILILWIGFEIIFSIKKNGSRTEIVLLAMSLLFLVHRFLYPLELWLIFATSIFILIGFFIFGIYRDGYDKGFLTYNASPLSSSNEFQAVFGTGYDLQQKRRKEFDLQIPWQVYANEILMFIPQQICPVEKIKPSQWYKESLNTKRLGGFCFGVIAQSAIGFGIIELILRSILLGGILAKVHNWYLEKNGDFLPTIFYLWLCLRIYYTFRSSTFHLVILIFYEIVPVFLLLYFLPKIVVFSQRYFSNLKGNF